MGSSCQLLYPNVGVLPSVFPQNYTEKPQLVGRGSDCHFIRNFVAQSPLTATPPNPQTRLMCHLTGACLPSSYLPLTLHTHIKVPPFPVGKEGTQVSVAQMGKTRYTFLERERGDFRPGSRRVPDKHGGTRLLFPDCLEAEAGGSL